ncbi:DUF6338 family protein [Candidatus Poriferisodalis sp.]|uniref:DUF6338 family protein n=1 Tax=Candidatus Poriferisodalis sp. TaxID=3101277 RepID=UPI003B022F1F
MSALAVATLLLLILLVPGVFAAWGYEQSKEIYSRRLRDWYARLAALTALCVAALAWPLYWLWTEYWDQFAARESLPRWLVVVPFAYIGLPALAGWLLGLWSAQLGQWSWFKSRRSAPTAWDYLFSERESGFVRCRLKSGRWVGGHYSRYAYLSSYAGLHSAERDIYIAEAVHLDQVDGMPLWHQGPSGETMTLVGGGILVKWEDIEELGFASTHELIPE